MSEERKPTGDHCPESGGGISGSERRFPTWLLAVVGFSGLVILSFIFFEIVSRLCGVGYDTRLLVPVEENGRSYWRENPRFFWRYMGREMARTPLPLRVLKEKPKGTLRIVILGESAALGDPEPAYGFGRFLDVLLRELFPGQEIEIVNMATTAINSCLIQDMAHELTKLKADIWVAYVGNNEFVGPYGPATVFNGGTNGSRTWIRLGLWIRHFRMAQLMDEWIAQLRSIGREGNRAWGGMEMFSQSALTLDSPARPEVVRHFRASMEDVIRTGTRHGAHVLVMPAVVNLLDCGPMASVARDSSWIQQATGLCKNHEWDSLRSLAEKELDRAPQSADAAYFLGLAESGSGHSDLAMEALTRACDWDLLPFRATTPLRRSLLSLDGTVPGVEVSDPSGRMQEICGEIVPGARTFFEHVHMTPLGNYGLAVHTVEKLLQQILTIRGSRGPSGSIPSFEHCRDMLGLTPFDLRSMAATMTSRVSEPPLNGRPGSRENRDHLLQMAASISREEINRSDSLYQFALAQRPNDWMIRQRFAIYLDETGRYSDALESIDIALEAVPHSPVLYFQRGVVLGKLNRHPEAAASFRQALHWRPSFAEAYLQLAWIDWRNGHHAEAIQGFQKSRQIDPNSESPQLALMIAWKESGEVGKYVEGLSSMLKDFPRSPMVQKELAYAMSQADLRDMVEGLLESLEDEDLRDAELLISRARLFRGQNRFEESLELLSRALAIDPEHAPAHYQMGLNQIQREEYALAIPHFLAVTASEPEFWSAHFNLGVALAKMNQIDAACSSLAAIPEGDANYEKAQEYLRRLGHYQKVPRC